MRSGRLRFGSRRGDGGAVSAFLLRVLRPWEVVCAIRYHDALPACARHGRARVHRVQTPSVPARPRTSRRVDNENGPLPCSWRGRTVGASLRVVMWRAWIRRTSSKAFGSPPGRTRRSCRPPRRRAAARGASIALGRARRPGPETPGRWRSVEDPHRELH